MRGNSLYRDRKICGGCVEQRRSDVVHSTGVRRGAGAEAVFGCGVVGVDHGVAVAPALRLLYEHRGHGFDLGHVNVGGVGSRGEERLVLRYRERLSPARLIAGVPEAAEGGVGGVREDVVDGPFVVDEEVYAVKLWKQVVPLREVC